MNKPFGVSLPEDPDQWVDLSSYSALSSLRSIHDKFGPRSAYAWAIGRPWTEPGGRFLTEDLDTQMVEDFIVNFYTEYNAQFGLTY